MTASTAPSGGEREVLTAPDGTGGEQQALDPYEEFVRLAGEHSLAAIAPGRYTDRPPASAAQPPAEPTSPAALDHAPEEERPEEVVETPQDVKPSPLWLTSRAELSPMNIATREMPTNLPADPAKDEQDVPDPYERFEILAREYLANEVASRPETDSPPTDSTPASPAQLEELPPEQASTGEAPVDVVSPSPTDQERTIAEPPRAEPRLEQLEQLEQLAPERHDEEDTPWPVGERRSAARQARKPLPAALQAAVASDAAPLGSAGATSQRSVSRRDLGAGDGIQDGPGFDRTRNPGIIRRYASAIAVIAIFVAAGGAAAGIAALRGPIAPPLSQTPAQDQAQANGALLRAHDFPAGWVVSDGATSSSFGVGSVLVTPSIVHFWLTAHPGCATPLDALNNAMTPSAGNPTAFGSTHAIAGDRLGGTWQIADDVAFHRTTAQVGGQVASVRSLLAGPNGTACVNQFWTAALVAELPAGSHVVMHVSPATISGLPGNPPLWALSMSGVATVRNVALPIYFEITQFAARRAEVTLVASAKVAPLSGGLDQRLLVRLVTSATGFGS